MGDMIKDGTGGGYLAKVDSKNRLRAYSVVEDEPTYINRVEKEMYSGMWSGAITSAGSDKFVVYLKNDSNKDMVIVKIKHRCEDASESMSFWLNVTGTPGGSLTELTPSNRNAGSNNTANVTFYKSSDITGLSNGRQVGSVYGKDGEEFEHAAPCSGYIIPQNGTFAIKCSGSTAKHYGGFSFYFRDAEA